MRHFLKNTADSLLRPLGLELRRAEDLHRSHPFAVQAQLTKKVNPTVFDVGAHVGNVCETYRRMFPGGIIHGFEPFPESYRALHARFADDPAVKLNELAVSNFEGPVKLHVNSTTVTNSLLSSDPEGSRSWGSGLLETQEMIQVASTTIDSYCQSNGIDSIDILKLDIQGSELRALEGAQCLLRSGRIAVVYLEVLFAPTYLNQPPCEDYLRFFRSFGYRLVDLYNLARLRKRLMQADALFVRAAEW